MKNIFLYIIAALIVLYFLFKPKKAEAKETDLIPEIAKQFGISETVLRKLRAYWKSLSKGNYSYPAFLDSRKLSDSESARGLYNASFETERGQLENIAAYFAWCLKRVKYSFGTPEQEAACYYRYGLTAVQRGDISEITLRGFINEIGI